MAGLDGGVARVGLPGGWDPAGMGQPSPFGRGEGAAGLGWLLNKEPGGCRGKQASVDLVAGDDATGDQAVETNPGLVQGVVAAASGGVGHGGELLVEDHLAVGMASRSRVEPCPRGWLRSLCSRVEEAAHPVGAAAGMLRGWGDDVAAAAPASPHGQAGRSGCGCRLGSGRSPSRSRSGPGAVQAQVVLGRELAERRLTRWAVDVEDVGDLARSSWARREPAAQTGR